MYKKRTIALLTLLLLIVVACTLARASLPTVTQVSPEEVVTETPEPIIEEPLLEPVETSVPKPSESETPIVVQPNPPVIDTPPSASKDCFIGGCSGQLCSDNPDLVSTCEWRDSYACYQTATCERQQTGECGWSETTALNACLRQADTVDPPVY